MSRATESQVRTEAQLCVFDLTTLGSIIPLQVGRMRNEFFPRRMADYTTPALVKQMKAEGKPIERDFTFGLQQYEIKDKESEAAVAPAPRKPKVELNLPEVRTTKPA